MDTASRADEGIFRGAGGMKFFYQRTDPPGDARAVLAVVRGTGGYRDLHAAMAATLAPHGYAVYGFDHREHTRRPGKRGYLREWSQSQHDVQAFVELIRSERARVPLFLIGNGLGGELALAYALRFPQDLAGVVAYGPAPVETEVEPLHRRVARSLGRIWPVPVVAEPPPLNGETEGHSLQQRPALTREEQGGRSGEIAVPHLIVGTEGGSAPDYDRLLTDLEAWIKERAER